MWCMTLDAELAGLPAQPRRLGGDAHALAAARHRRDAVVVRGDDVRVDRRERGVHEQDQLEVRRRGRRHGARAGASVYSSLPPTTPGTSHSRLRPMRCGARHRRLGARPRLGSVTAIVAGPIGPLAVGELDRLAVRGHEPGRGAAPGELGLGPPPTCRAEPLGPAGSSSSDASAAAMADGSSGSTVSPASPTTSAVAVPAEVTTGVPWAIASSTGRPKPSCRLGKQNDRRRGVERRQVGRGHEPDAPDPAARPTLDGAPARRSSPRGPAITSSTSSRPRRAKASRSRGRFLRGSIVPSQSTKVSGSR